MKLTLFPALALTVCCVACTYETTAPSRSARAPYNDSARPLGNDDVHGGNDMPGKGRAGEHDRHSVIHK